MIYTTLIIPCQDLLSLPSDNLTNLFNYISRVGLITPIILRLECIDDIFIHGQQVQLLLIALKQITRMAPCHVEGIPLPNDVIKPTDVEDFAISLLGF